MFSVPATQQKFENATITGLTEFVFKENHYHHAIVFKKLRFQWLKMFYVHPKTKTWRFQILGLKNVSKKLRFRDVLVWTVGLTVEIKAAFSNFSGGAPTFPCCKTFECFKYHWITFVPLNQYNKRGFYFGFHPVIYISKYT